MNETTVRWLMWKRISVEVSHLSIPTPLKLLVESVCLYGSWLLLIQSIQDSKPDSVVTTNI